MTTLEKAERLVERKGECSGFSCDSRMKNVCPVFESCVLYASKLHLDELEAMFTEEAEIYIRKYKKPKFLQEELDI